jgi:ribonuclease PH
MPSNNRPAVSRVEMDLAGRTLSFESGLVAQQADGAVVVRYGDSTVLTTVVGEQEPNASVGFFPLTVEYEERMYAAGKIPGGFIKREGRPTEAATLAARLTDRPIRPLFPKGYKSEVQVITTVMSADQENDPDILSINGASAALTLSQIPWDGPIGAVRVGYVDGEILINPTESDLVGSTLDMVVAGTSDAIMMVEGESDQVSEETLVAGIERAHGRSGGSLIFKSNCSGMPEKRNGPLRHRRRTNRLSRESATFSVIAYGPRSIILTKCCGSRARPTSGRSCWPTWRRQVTKTAFLSSRKRSWMRSKPFSRRRFEAASSMTARAQTVGGPTRYDQSGSRPATFHGRTGRRSSLAARRRSSPR